MEWWSAAVVVCLEQGADLHMVQLMPLPLTVTCFSKIQIGFTFLVVAHLGSPGKRAVKWVCVCVCVCVPLLTATSTFGLGRRCWSSPQHCYLLCLCTVIFLLQKYDMIY